MPMECHNNLKKSSQQVKVDSGSSNILLVTNQMQPFPNLNNLNNPFKPEITIVIFIHYKPRKPEFIIVIFIHYKPWIATAIFDL